jgi:outer membrane receptor protein involved in Fe transport
LIPGGRYDRDNTYGESWSPRIQLLVKPNNYWKLSASANRSFQAPTFADLYDPFAPPPYQAVQVNPEITWSYDLGATAIPMTGMDAAITLFRADTRDRIALDPNRGFAAFNLDRAYSEGTEMSVSYAFSGIRQRLSYTYLKTVGEDNGSNYEWLAFTPKHSIQYRADIRLPWNASFTDTLRYLHRQWTGLGETGIEVPGYVTNNIRASEKIEWITLFVEIDNLFDRHYAETADAFNGYYPQPGRTYSGGLILKFQK